MSKHEDGKAIKIAAIGCGYWGKNLIRNFSELGALAAVYDVSADAAQKMAAAFDVPAVGLQAILSNSSIQGVAIAAPAALHAEIALQALQAGKDVFVEKPLALTIEAAKEVADCAQHSGRILMIGHLLQYHPVYIHLKKIVLSGELGELKYIRSNRLSFGKVRNEEDVLWSFAPHDISMVLGLVGHPVQSIAAHGQTVHGAAHPDAVSLDMRFEDGAAAQINVGWLSPFKEQKLTVIGTKGMAVFDDTLAWDDKLVLTRYTVDKSVSPPVAEKSAAEKIAVLQSEPLRNECMHFIECIQHRAEPVTNAAEALKVLNVLTEASRQIGRKTNAMIRDGVFVHESSYVDENVLIGKGSKIWHFSHILSGTKIGDAVVIGQNCMIGPQVSVGDRCKIQNNVSLYKGVTLEEEVFCGPSCVFTNVNNPRAAIDRKDEFRPTLVRKGVTIGANATIVCGHELGEYSFIAAGAVVAQDVPAHAMMAGVPARRIGWMSHAGAKLDGNLTCPIEGRRYRLAGDRLEEIRTEVKKSA